MGRRRKNPFYSPPPLSSSPHHSSEQGFEPSSSPITLAVDVANFSPAFPCVTPVHTPLPSPRVEDLGSPKQPPYISLILSREPSPPPSPTPLPQSRTGSPELRSPNFNFVQTDNVPGWVSQQSSPPTPTTFPHITPGYVSRMPTPIGDSLIHHSDYYLEDGVVFLVDNTFFKVPRYMLNQESEDFRQLYSDQFDPVGKGSTDADPISLNSVGARDFERLLRLLYPRSRIGTPNVTEHWTETEWESVLHLAVMWQMPQVRHFAVENLSACASSMTKILLGRRYGVPAWIRAGFLDLCLRESAMTDEEGSQLDWKDILKISRARETIRFKVLGINRQQQWEYTGYGRCRVYKTSYDPAKYRQNRMVHHILDEIFGLEDLSSNTHPASDIDSNESKPPLWLEVGLDTRECAGKFTT